MLLHLRSCVVRLTLAANGSSGSKYMSYRTSGALIKKRAAFTSSSAELNPDRFTLWKARYQRGSIHGLRGAARVA